MDKAIGGYFGLELGHGKHFHTNTLQLNSARSCLEYILRVRQYKKVHIPYYTCSIVLQPFDLLHIPYEFYHIDNKLEPISLPKLEKDEAFLYTNYFGLKQNCVERLVSHYGKQLIVDNAQAFFAERIDSIDTFYSPRKFLGVPDGGYLYIDTLLENDIPQAHSFDRVSHLLKRIDVDAETGYDDFKLNDNQLAQQPMLKMSKLTEALLASIDYAKVQKIRKQNFIRLDNALKVSNKFCLPTNEEFVPLAYPYLCDEMDLKQKLVKQKIFVPTYWPNVLDWCDAADFEYRFAKNIVSLPIDQRYGEEEMNRIIEILV